MQIVQRQAPPTWGQNQNLNVVVHNQNQNLMGGGVNKNYGVMNGGG